MNTIGTGRPLGGFFIAIARKHSWLDPTDHCRVLLGLLCFLALASAMAGAGPAPLPECVSPLTGPPGSHAFLAAAHQAVPFDLAAVGYVEEEFLIAGNAGLYDWPNGCTPVAQAQGP